ncbi:MAG TPA: serine--tRNA ligase, partial [Thermodesulfobacteriota bacterium]|nr:serine--tRNA ligase [Thermodesulfobacteriota bacterium]
MLDIKFVRDNIAEVERRLATRGGSLDLTGLKALDEKRRALLTESEQLKSKRNAVSEEIGRLKKEKKDASHLMAEMQEEGARIKALDAELASCEKELNDLLLVIPNLPNPSVPVGKDETENPVTRVWGTLPKFGFTPLEHTDVGERLGILDFERAGKLSGARFSLQKGPGALLERALINFMLDL